MPASTRRSPCEGSSRPQRSARLAAQPGAHVAGQELQVRRDALGAARAMSPDARNRCELAVVQVHYDSVGVDVPEDVARVERLLREGQPASA